ncbi:NADase-type glycan-binding domain-containing protein [Nocardioides sp.]|uniref:NADase-type glycan-binding domain-containing protein n=1 Tax=Nocardioides sp. TaxID=35761 RepID=UPI00286C7F51|nr:hypothetical protein [Nocardioides sp.]
METCAQCGHQLGLGRFCINCGLPVDRSWGTDTAERPAVLDPMGLDPAGPTVSAPRTPPPVLEPLQQPRFPLYADQVGHPGPPPSGPPPLPLLLPPPGGHHREPRRRPAWLPWVLAALALLLTAGLGGILLLTGGDEETTREPVAVGSPSSTPSSTPSSSDATSPSPTPTPSPSETPTDPDPPQNLARFATAAVPDTAPPNQDVDGNQVRYEARNMLDDVRTTCWRTPGDASGQTITLTLDGPTTLSRVGLVNGYAKTSEAGSSRLNWYRGNRRVLAVEWTFDDGTTVSQSLVETRTMQTIDLEPVLTSTVTLRLVGVSSPGAGPSARDYTAISDLALVGSPATES